RFESGPNSVDHGFAPDAVEIGIRPGGIQQVAGWKRLELARSEMVNDQPMKHRSEVIAKATLALVGSCKLAGQQLGPKFLKHLIGQVLIPNLQVNVSRHGIMVSIDKLLHGRLALGAN